MSGKHCRYSLIVVALAAVVLALTSGSASADPPAPPGTPRATSFNGVSTVGPLFRDGLSADHECTASVVASATHDLILTVAHCVSGTAAGWQFAPGYHRGKTPYGVWTVTQAYLDPHWINGQDPRYDYALLRVARDGSVGIQDVTGANRLRTAPRGATEITDVAYNAGIHDKPVHCTTAVYFTDGFPSFNCHGFVGGSSGSPWLTPGAGTHRDVVRGIIGGLHQGGCYEYTSYSSPFTSAVFDLLQRAEAGEDPDVAPEPGGDGC